MLIELRLNQFNHSLIIDDSEINMQRTPEHRIKFIETEVVLAARQLIEHAMYRPGLPFGSTIVGQYQPYSGVSQPSITAPTPYNETHLIEDIVLAEMVNEKIQEIRGERREKRRDERFDEERMERIVYDEEEE